MIAGIILKKAKKKGGEGYHLSFPHPPLLFFVAVFDALTLRPAKDKNDPYK